MTTIDNLRRGARRRSLQIVVPSTLVVLGLAGVATRPSLGLAAARAERERVEELLRETHDEALLRGRLGGAEGRQRARAALERVRGLVPPPLPELELHGLVRWLVTSHGLRLETLQVGERRDSGLDRVGDAVALRSVRLEGTGAHADVLDLVSSLRSLGRPVAVLEFALQHLEDGDERFELTVGLFEACDPADLPAANPDADVSSPSSRLEPDR